MAGVNKTIIVGNLGRDPELNETGGGTKVCRLNVATTRTWMNKNTNEKEEETEWHRVTVWGKQGENCAKFLKKGRQVYIEGRLRTSSYEKDDYPGAKFYTTEIVADQVQFLGGKGDGESGGGGGDNRSGGGGGGGGGGRGGNNESDPDDDIPF
jgi:single-strand DNA-binding protein